MSGRPWYPHYLDDYARDTAHLTMLQHGAYRLLLDHYYATAKALTASAEQLHRICRANSLQEVDAVNYILSEFFNLRAGKYHHKRVDLELERAANISEKRGKAAKSRHSKGVSKSTAFAEQLHVHPQPQVHPHKEERVPLPKGNGRQVAATDGKVDPWKAVYDRGKEILGPNSGGVITNLRKTLGDKPAKVMAKLEDAAEKRNPDQWIAAFLFEHGPSGEYVGQIAPLP